MAGLSAHIPIAELSPELHAQSSKSVKAIVTLTWPYSSATGSVAFLLAEPDFRLRRSKGQVRVQFSGSSAKRIAKSGIASGDEVVVSLDGVEWLRNATAPSTPGSGVDFELKFTERLLLQFTQEGSETKELIDIDHPPQEPEQDVLPNRATTPELTPSLESHKLPKTHDTVLKNGDEWSSPAFIKRARTSYGSLFDTGYDPFTEEDGTIPGKGRKKSRLSSTWRYVSRSPTPELEYESIPDASITAATTAAPVVADEGSQTIPLGDTDAAETLANFSREAGSMLKNFEASLTGEAHEHFSPHLPQIRTTEMQPPTAHIRFGLSTADAAQQADLPHSNPTQAPISPRLKPIPSDALPLVSPLVTSQPSPFKADTERPSAIDNQPFNPLTPEALGLPSDTSVSKLADHSADHYEEQHAPLSTFQEHSMNADELHDTGFDNDPHDNDTFSHWHSPNIESDLLGPGHSTYQPQRTFYVGEIEESSVVARRFGDNLTDPGSIMQPNIPSYPEYEHVDAELHSQGADNLWTRGPVVAYPELPEPQGEISHIESHRLSSSPDKIPLVKDTTPGVVDLTESDEDEEEQAYTERSLDDRAGEGSIEASESEEREVEEEQDELEEASDIVSEEYSEENEGFDHYNYGKNLSEEDGEAEGFDEDEAEEDGPFHSQSAPREPVVIDLLSSDDEDNMETAVPAPRPQQATSLEEASESEEEEQAHDDVDEEMGDSQELDAEKDVPYSLRSELPTSIPRHASPEDEDAPFSAENDDGHAEKEGNAIEDFEGAREKRDTNITGKESIPHTPAIDAVDIMPAVVIQTDEVAAVPALSEATNGSFKDSKLPADKATASRRRLPEDLIDNLDGANDDVRSPPKKTASRKRSRDLKPKSHVVVTEQTQPPLQNSIQLPTPDATQVSFMKDSQEDSTAASSLPMTDDLQAATTVLAIGVIQNDKADTTIDENDIVPVDATDIQKDEVRTSEVEVAVEDTSTNANDTDASQDRTVENKTSIRHTSARLSHDSPKPEAQPGNHDGESQKINPPSPRRSRRIRHASGSAEHIAEIMRPSTPDHTREEGKVDEKSPATPNSLVKQGGQDPSIEMAMSALKPSPKAHHDLRSTSIVDLKLSLSRALRTDLSEFTALKVLRFHISQKLDVFGIVTRMPEEPQRTKGGPRHYQMTFNITDSSIAPSGVTEVQVHRPHIEALPVVVPGDGILLRNFQVIAIKNRGFALRSEPNEACSWAVFKEGVTEPEIRGPPVEYGEAEKKHMAAMKEWYGTLDSTAVAKLQRANAEKGAGVSGGKGVGKVL